MKNFEDLSRLLQREHEHERHEASIGEENAEKCAPDNRMGPANIGVWKLRYSEGNNCQKGKKQWPSVIFINVRIVFISEVLLPVFLDLVNFHVCKVVE